MPDGYGVGENATVTLDWATVLDKLTASKHYWLASVRPDGTTIPAGCVAGCRFFYDGAPTTVHAPAISGTRRAHSPGKRYRRGDRQRHLGGGPRTR